MAEQCAECGFDWDLPLQEGLRTIEDLPTRAREIVERAGETVYRRPDGGGWSANEYIWHLADTFHSSSEWLHDIRTRDHPTHYATDNDALAQVRGYERLPAELGLWSLEQSCRLFVDEAARTDPSRTCYYHDWQDVAAGLVVSFLMHEAVHHLYDLERLSGLREASYAH
jgi:hypothetical protein